MISKINNRENLKGRIYWGIDLGTSYTVVAQVVGSSLEKTDNGQVPILLVAIEQQSPLELDAPETSELVASILAINDDSKMFVGNKLHKLKANPNFDKDKNIFYHWKLDLGISQKPLYPQALRNDVDDAAKVAGKILNYCRIKANGNSIWRNVIVTVPASFQANQRNDVMQAIRYAQIEEDDQMLIDEPNAAFIGYLNQLSDKDRNELFASDKVKTLVIDFGGGTCDLSTLVSETTEGYLKMSNLAISRYNDLGGQDVDMIVAERYLLPMVREVLKGIEFRADEIERFLMPQLAVIGEKLKIDICRTIAASFLNVEDITPESVEVFTSTLKNQQIKVSGNTYNLEKIEINGRQMMDVTIELFRKDEYSFSIVDKVIQSVPCVIDQILDKSNWNKKDVEYVLLAGGSVQNPLFVQKVKEILPESKVLLPRRPDTLVAVGAAICSLFKYGTGENLIQPISSESIGILTNNVDFYQLIPQSAKLPYKAWIPKFSVQQNNQSQVELPFCIKSSENVVGNLKCALPHGITVDDVIEVEVELTLDKVFKAKVEVNGKYIGEAELNNPEVKVFASPEERKLSISQFELESARLSNNKHQEKTLLRKMIWEYYDIGNYARTISTAEVYLQKFVVTDVYVLNIIHCAYKNLGQLRKAEEYLDKGLALEPFNSVLVYNKSLIIERSKGKNVALNYLESFPEHVKDDNSVKLRMVLLRSELGDMNDIANIISDYQQGKLSIGNNFDSDLLNQVFIKAGVEEKHLYKKSIESASIFNNSSLLVVKQKD